MTWWDFKWTWTPPSDGSTGQLVKNHQSINLQFDVAHNIHKSDSEALIMQTGQLMVIMLILCVSSCEPVLDMVVNVFVCSRTDYHPFIVPNKSCAIILKCISRALFSDGLNLTCTFGLRTWAWFELSNQWLPRLYVRIPTLWTLNNGNIWRSHAIIHSDPAVFFEDD
jgi:hypothetical protein